jgi:hypothetical protein
MKFVLLPAAPIAVVGHGVIYEPPARISGGLNILNPTCAGGSCLWFNQGCTIGCPKATGNSGTPLSAPDCKKKDGRAEPTLKFEDKGLRTYALDEIYRLDDYTKYHPWRYPGSAPIIDPCGLAGGWYTPGAEFAGGWAPPGVSQGVPGSFAPWNTSLTMKTRWVAGSTAEVAWGITANHGGGYQYRLCPNNGGDRNETCFQKMPLDFVGDTQWIQFGHGMDVNNRTEIPAVTVSGDKVIPVNSTWRRNPVPPCNTPISGGAVSKRKCLGPTFKPPIPGLYGFGPGACGSSEVICNLKQFREHNFDFGIVDKVHVPDLPEGEYILSFRWESEQTNQVWNSCADVTIVKEGPATKPYTEQDNCDACCDGMFNVCSNCTSCLNDKTGDCAYCWNTLPGYNPSYAPDISCLGHEAPDGGAKKWYPGDDPVGGWSPGCPKCWADPSRCASKWRPFEEVPVSV